MLSRTWHASTFPFVMTDTSASFSGVHLQRIDVPTESTVTVRLRHYETSIRLDAVDSGSSVQIVSLDIENSTEWCRGAVRHVLFTPRASVALQFPNSEISMTFASHLSRVCGTERSQSAFDRRTEDISAKQYFQFYGYLSQQQNMMLDFTRTSTYQRAFLQNAVDFKDKIVIDVGAGSGILSFFALQAGAKKVYAIEGSSVAEYCELLVKHNRVEDKIKVIYGKVEEVEIPEKVDVIISEPMGYMLVNERMLETFIHARKWLKPNGKMFPTQGVLYVVPFTDDALYIEQYSKAYFWSQQSFHGVDLSSLRQAAIAEYFRQPVVDTFDHRILIAKPTKHVVNFIEDSESTLQDVTIPLNFTVFSAGSIHGLAFWFDVAFMGSTSTVWLSTGPNEPLTHWYQVRCLIPTPLFVAAGQTVRGHVQLTANRKQSYSVNIELSVDGTTSRATNTLDLKNPFFRYTGQPPQAPPGSHSTSPTEIFWNTVSTALAHSPGVGGAAVGPASIPVEPIAYTGAVPPTRSLNHSVSHIIGGGGGGAVPLLPAMPSAADATAADASVYSQPSPFVFNGGAAAGGAAGLLTRPVYPNTSSKFGKSHT